jgi:phosphoribosylaminoimidazolecarboxamide formyltransferase/IMP cyclohydrolase
LIQNGELNLPIKQVRTCLNGLFQERNNITDNKADLKTVTTTSPSEQERRLYYCQKFVRTPNQILLSSQKNNTNFIRTGQTSRVDALVQAVQKLWI